MNINDTTTVNGEATSAQKSHAEIIAECYRNTASTQYVRELLDRLEAAHRRECGDMAKMREVMNRVHDYLGELIRDNLVEDTPRASDLADDVYDAIHGSHSTEVPTKSMGPKQEGDAK